MKDHSDIAPDTPAAGFPITDEAEACTAVLLACLLANEIEGMPENAVFHTTIRSRNIFQGYDPEKLIEGATRRFEAKGNPLALIDAAIGAIREQTRQPLLYQCLDMILSDGLVTPREHKVFQYLKGKFKVNDDDAWKAMDILVIKNQL